MTFISQKITLLSISSALVLAACGDQNKDAAKDSDNPAAFASTYVPLPSETTLITNAHIF